VSSATTIRRRMIGVFVATVFAIGPARAAEPLSDPTRPPDVARANVAAVAPSGNGELALHAIFHADDRRIAVINGVRVRESESIEGARVLAIEADRVRLQRGTEIVELELVSPAFKNARLAGERPGDAAAATDRAGTADPKGGSK
jgi:hypothetical protein